MHACMRHPVTSQLVDAAHELNAELSNILGLLPHAAQRNVLVVDDCSCAEPDSGASQVPPAPSWPTQCPGNGKRGVHKAGLVVPFCRHGCLQHQQGWSRRSRPGRLAALRLRHQNATCLTKCATGVSASLFSETPWLSVALKSVLCRQSIQNSMATQPSMGSRRRYAQHSHRTRQQDQSSQCSSERVETWFT